MKQINLKLYFLFGLLFCLFSCAEEGPYRMGKLECDVNAVVTPHDAMISVDDSNNRDYIMLVDRGGRGWLVEQPLKNPQDFDPAKAIQCSHHNNDCYTFNNLAAQTTYYFIIESSFNFNSYDPCYLSYFYYTDCSFTTPKEGDYSGVGDAYCKLNDTAQEGYTKVEITLPYNLSLVYNTLGYVEASESPDMINAIRAYEIYDYHDY